MQEYKNIILKNTAKSLGFRPKNHGGKTNKYPKRDRNSHANLISSLLKQSFDNDYKQKEENFGVSKSGIYLEFFSFPEYDLTTKSLENSIQGISLLNIHYDKQKEITSATVYIPKGKEGFFLKKIDSYRTENTKKGNPKNSALIESIDNIQLAVINSFWTGNKEEIPREEKKWCEVWFRLSSNNKEKNNLNALETEVSIICKELKISIKPDRIIFPERIVKLLFVSEEDLKQLIIRCDYIAEIRQADEPVSFFTSLSSKESQEWISDLLERTSYKLDGTTICLLDTGLNNKHILLEKATNDNHILTTRPEWKIADSDGHGTQMAGVALYFDLKKHLLNNQKLLITHEIESVKLLSVDEENDRNLYGYLTKQAISNAEIANPNANRVTCIAITSPYQNLGDGSPTSWSGAIDNIISGAEEDDIKRLIIISAGNVRTDEIQNAGYPNANILHSVESPAQAWNAITVGAYSGIIEIEDKELKGFNAICNVNELSPYSSTSTTWGNNWPIKPDVLFMGGNIATNGTDFTSCHDLSILTTNYQQFGNSFTSIHGTSAASAQAAWFAAQIASEYPSLWPETIRGLMIHSADWPEDMKKQFCTDNKKTSGIRNLLRACGYGIPNLHKAIICLKNSVNMIIESELQPFTNKSMNEMHIHKIPWPHDVLLAMGNTPVTLRVTLSYYIEPGPGEIGWKNKYRYQSCGLRFDVKNTNENQHDFEKRINAQMCDNEDDIVETKSGNSRWYLGPKNRNVGSIHSDMMIDMNAIDLCDCDSIAVYPVVGWWRERSNLGKTENKQRYSLIVSLSTPSSKIDLYTEIQTKINNIVQISV